MKLFIRMRYKFDFVSFSFFQMFLLFNFFLIEKTFYVISIYDFFLKIKLLRIRRIVVSIISFNICAFILIIDFYINFRK